MPQVDALALARLLQALADQFGQSYGIPMRYRPLNDGEYWDAPSKTWKKVFPSSVTGLEHAMQLMVGVQEGRPEAEIAARVITPPPEKFSDKQVRGVAERVGSLEEAIGERPDHARVKLLVVQAVKQAFNIELAVDDLTDVEKEYMSRAAAKFDNEAWLLARSERGFDPVSPEMARGEAIAKPPNGPLLRVTVLCQGGTLRKVLFTGGLHVSPIDALVALERELQGVAAGREAIEGAVSAFFVRTGALTPILPCQGKGGRPGADIMQ